jgi:hypothetical protein
MRRFQVAGPSSCTNLTVTIGCQRYEVTLSRCPAPGRGRTRHPPGVDSGFASPAHRIFWAVRAFPHHQHLVRIEWAFVASSYNSEVAKRNDGVHTGGYRWVLSRTHPCRSVKPRGMEERNAVPVASMKAVFVQAHSKVPFISFR